jgi:hypothetical protein
MFVRTFGFIAALSFCLVESAAAQQPAAQPPADPAAAKKDHVAAIKDSLQKSGAALRQYEWIETTAVSMKGEEKSRTQNKCAYLPDGKVLKTPLSAPPPDSGKQPRGVKGKVVENKKADIAEATKEAVGLIKQYVPPDPNKIQAAKAAGKLSVTPPDSGGQVRMVIKDYLKPGDSLTIDLNAATDRMAGMTVPASPTEGSGRTQDWLGGPAGRLGLSGEDPAGHPRTEAGHRRRELRLQEDRR